MTVRALVPVLTAGLAVAGCTDARRPTGPPPASPAASAPATSPGAPAASETLALPTLPPGPQAPAGLTEHYWSLAEYVRPGGRPVRPLYRSTLRFESGRFTARACNTIQGVVRYGEDHYERAGPSSSTDKACRGDDAAIEAAVSRVTTAARVAWERPSGRLVLRADGWTLRYDGIDAAYPDGRAHTLARGERAGWTYRLYTAPMPYGVKVGLAMRDAAGKSVLSRGAGEPNGPTPAGDLTAFGVGKGPITYVGGFAATGTVRVTYRPPGAAAVALPVYDGVPGSRFVAFGAPVGALGGRLTAYGPDGRVLATGSPR